MSIHTYELQLNLFIRTVCHNICSWENVAAALAIAQKKHL
jgi:hypothetical protein